MPDVDRGPLGEDIDRFVDVVANELAELSATTSAAHRRDVTVEAANIVAAALDADSRLTDDEAWAYVLGIGTISEPSFIGTPGRGPTQRGTEQASGLDT